jgi:phospholipid N-methyltransferase
VGEHAQFLGAFVRDPFATGAVVPSSRALAERMVEGFDLAHARIVVEAGPGTGAFTRALLETCSSDATVVAVEVNARFVTWLQGRYPRVHVVHDLVERLSAVLRSLSLPPADVVISGLPWAILDDGTQVRLLDGIAGGLRNGRAFATFGYLHCRLMAGSRRFLRLLAGTSSEWE